MSTVTNPNLTDRNHDNMTSASTAHGIDVLDEQVNSYISPINL